MGMAGLSSWAWQEAAILLEASSRFTGCIFTLLAALFVWGIVLCQADAFSRFREFKRLRAILLRYGFHPRALHPLSTSRCQRDAALLAATETGFRKQAHHYFMAQGYRWYHIIPNALLSNPLHFFHPEFLRVTFLPGKRTAE